MRVEQSRTTFCNTSLLHFKTCTALSLRAMRPRAFSSGRGRSLPQHRVRLCDLDVLDGSNQAGVVQLLKFIAPQVQVSTLSSENKRGSSTGGLLGSHVQFSTTSQGGTEQDNQEQPLDEYDTGERSQTTHTLYFHRGLLRGRS